MQRTGDQPRRIFRKPGELIPKESKKDGHDPLARKHSTQMNKAVLVSWMRRNEARIQAYRRTRARSDRQHFCAGWQINTGILRDVRR